MEVQDTEPKCSLCGAIVDDYCPEFVEQMKTNFGDFKDFQVFYNNFKKDPDSVHDQCITCRKSKWQNMKYTSNRQVRPPHTQTRGQTADGPIKKWLVQVVILSLVFGVIGSQISNYFNTSNADNLKFTMRSLKSKFPSLQQSILNKLGGALLRLEKPGEPIVFMLLHDHTNKRTTDCLVSHASNLAKKYIFTNPQKSLWMNGSEWTSYSDFDHEDLLYKKLITPLENNVLVLENLQDLPWSLAKTLHHLCDTENPTFAKAMYLLELRVKDDLQQLSEREKILVAKRAMNMVWQDAPDEFRVPLIARLTSYVDAVLWESDQPCHRESFISISP